MKNGEEFFCRVYPSPRLPRVVLTPHLQHGRQDPSDPEARKSTDHKSEHSVKYREICRSHFEDTRFRMMHLHWKIIPAWLHGKKEVGTENRGKFCECRR